MSYGIIFAIDDDQFLMTQHDGKFIGFKDTEAAIAYMSAITEANAKENGTMAALFFVTSLNIGLIKYPKEMKDIAVHLNDFKPETNESKLHCHGVAGVKMFGLSVKESIEEYKYVPTRPEPQTPMSTSDNNNPYSDRNWSHWPTFLFFMNVFDIITIIFIVVISVFAYVYKNKEDEDIYKGDRHN